MPAGRFPYTGQIYATRFLESGLRSLPQIGAGNERSGRGVPRPADGGGGQPRRNTRPMAESSGKGRYNMDEPERPARFRRVALLLRCVRGPDLCADFPRRQSVRNLERVWTGTSQKERRRSVREGRCGVRAYVRGGGCCRELRRHKPGKTGRNLCDRGACHRHCRRSRIFSDGPGFRRGLVDRAGYSA